MFPVVIQAVVDEGDGEQCWPFPFLLPFEFLWALKGGGHSWGPSHLSQQKESLLEGMKGCGVVI